MRSVLFLDQSGARAGGQTVLANLVEHLRDVAPTLRCAVAVPNGPIHERLSAVPDLKVIRPTTHRSWVAASWASSGPYDWLVANSPKVLPHALAARAASRLRGADTRVAFVVHSNPSSRAKAHVISGLARGVDAVLPVAASQWSPSPHRRLPPLGLRSRDLIEPAALERGLHRRRRIVKAMGQRDPVKGLDVYLDAVAQLGPLRPAWTFELATAPPLEGGGDYDRKLLAAAEGVAVAGGRDATWIQPGDVVVIPSRDEAACLFAQEAMGRGAFLVASAVGDIPRFVENGTSGLLVPPGDPTQLAHALRRVAALPEQQFAAVCRRAHAAMLARADHWYDEVAGLLEARGEPACAA